MSSPIWALQAAEGAIVEDEHPGPPWQAGVLVDPLSISLPVSPACKAMTHASEHLRLHLHLCDQRPLVPFGLEKLPRRHTWDALPTDERVTSLQ